MRRHEQATTVVGVGWWCRFWRLLLVLVVVLVTAIRLRQVEAGYERACSVDEMIGRRAGVCGSRLVDLLRVVCRSVYNKRSTTCEHLL